MNFCFNSAIFYDIIKKMNNHKWKILIIDDDKFFCDIKVDLLEANNYKADSIQSADKVIDKLQSSQYDLILLDLNIGGVSGIEILQKIKKFDPEIEVIMLTGFETIPTAVQAIKKGAYDYLQKSINDDELLIKMDRAIERRKSSIEIRTLKDALTKHFGFTNIIGTNKQMQNTYNLVKTVCNTEATVLIKGETGTGKELIAKAIHFNSQRKDNPFVAVNCAAISEHLMESELFGHEKGAFTDAYKQRIGKIEEANLGTLFLDEIGDMPPNLQAKLLRFLQDKTFERVGSNAKLTSNIRVIAATNKNLLEMIRGGSFREDLYYRINVVCIELPPLRNRVDDLPLLIDHFIKLANIKFNKAVRGVSNEAMKMLKEYQWPGNIRELENLFDRLILTSTKDIINAEEISHYLKAQEIAPLETLPSYDIPLREVREEVEKKYIIELLKKYHGNIKLVSEKAEMERRSIFLKMEKYGLKKEDFKKTV